MDKATIIKIVWKKGFLNFLRRKTGRTAIIATSKDIRFHKSIGIPELRWDEVQSISFYRITRISAHGHVKNRLVSSFSISYCDQKPGSYITKYIDFLDLEGEQGKRLESLLIAKQLFIDPNFEESRYDPTFS